MNVVRYKELERAEFELQSKFSSKDVMFFRRGDGIDNPIYYVVSQRHCGSLSSEEAIKAGKVLIEAGNAAKSFRYNGYFIDWSDTQ